jgi:hypothetical protein
MLYKEGNYNQLWTMSFMHSTKWEKEVYQIQGVQGAIHF